MIPSLQTTTLRVRRFTEFRRRARIALWIFSGMLFTCAACKAAEPVLVVIESGTWASYGPVLAIYDDGSVIWRQDVRQKDPEFFHGKTRSAAAAVAEILPANFAQLSKGYSLTQFFDATATTIWTPGRTISVYGSWREIRPPPAPGEVLSEFEESERRMQASLPLELRNSLLRIDEQRKHKGDPWLPDAIEVSLESSGDLKSEPIPWPKSWPGLSPRAVKRNDARYTIPLLPTYWPAFQQLLEKQKQGSPVLIDGKRMSVSYRFPFPREERWRPIFKP